MSIENGELEDKLLNKKPIISFVGSFSEDEKKDFIETFENKDAHTNENIIQYDLFKNNLSKNNKPHVFNKAIYKSEDISIILKDDFLYIYRIFDNSILKLSLVKNNLEPSKEPRNGFINILSYNLENFLNSKLYYENLYRINMLELINSIPREFSEEKHVYKYYDSDSEDMQDLFSFIYDNIVGEYCSLLSKNDLIILQFISYIICFKFYTITFDIDKFIREYIQQFNKKSLNCLSAFEITEFYDKEETVQINSFKSYRKIKFQNEVVEKINITGKSLLYYFEENKLDISDVLYTFYKIYKEINNISLFDIKYYNEIFNLKKGDNGYIFHTEKDNDLYNKMKSGISLFKKKLNISDKNETAIDKKIHELINVEQDLIYLKNKEDIININKTLNEEFPWMQNVNKEIVENLILNYEFNTSIKLPPIFINGKTGIGKSYYINRLTQLLNIPYIKYSAGGKNEFLDFIGTSSNWGGSKPSLMCQLIANHNVLNPLIFIDELDKSLSNHNGDLQSSLLNLIDKNDAKHYFETYLSQNVDFSHINWIFAINDTSKINQFILDRAKVVEVSQPKEEHFELIYNNILESYSKENNIEVSKLLDVNISKNKILNDFKMNYSLRKMKETIYKDISNHYYDKFFNINEKPKFNVV